jgi:hypothetical protein
VAANSAYTRDDPFPNAQLLHFMLRDMCCSLKVRIALSSTVDMLDQTIDPIDYVTGIGR